MRRQWTQPPGKRRPTKRRRKKARSPSTASEPDLEKVRDFLAETYPGVELETLTTTTATDKIRTERQSGQFLVDAYLGGGTTALSCMTLVLPKSSRRQPKWPVQVGEPAVVVHELPVGGLRHPGQRHPDQHHAGSPGQGAQEVGGSARSVLERQEDRHGPPRPWGAGQAARGRAGSSTRSRSARTSSKGSRRRNPVLDAGSAAPDIDATARGEYAAYLPPTPRRYPRCRVRRSSSSGPKRRGGTRRPWWR